MKKLLYICSKRVFINMEKRNIFYEDTETGIIVDADGNFEFPIKKSVVLLWIFVYLQCLNLIYRDNIYIIAYIFRLKNFLEKFFGIAFLYIK